MIKFNFFLLTFTEHSLVVCQKSLAVLKAYKMFFKMVYRKQFIPILSTSIPNSFSIPVRLSTSSSGCNKDVGKNKEFSLNVQMI